MRIVVELKKDANPQVVLNRLFSQTQLQTTFAINMLALVNNQSQPRILSLRHILDEYLAYQEEIITRRTKYDLRKALERAHLLEGLIIAQDNIDEVVHIIRSSYDNARENLMNRFGLDDVQAQAILDMVSLPQRLSAGGRTFQGSICAAAAKQNPRCPGQTKSAPQSLAARRGVILFRGSGGIGALEAAVRHDDAAVGLGAGGVGGYVGRVLERGVDDMEPP